MTRRLPKALIAVLAAAALAAASCADDSSDTPAADPAPDDASTTTTEPGEDVVASDDPIQVATVVTPSEVSPIAARVTVESNVAVTVQITATADDHEVTTPVTAQSATEHDLPLVGMRQARDYEVAMTVVDAAGNVLTTTEPFTTGTIDDNVPDFEIVEHDPDRRSPGITIVETNTVRAALPGDFGGNAVVGLDEDDEIVWYYNTDRFNGAVQQTPAGEVAAQNDPFGMTVHAITGEALRRYYPDPEGDDEITVEDGVALTPYHADWVDLGTVHHDLQWQPDGTAFAISRTIHEIPVARQQELCPGDELEWGVISDVIMHIEPDGTVLRTWDLWDISSFDDLPGEFLCQTQGLGITPTERDWTHANALWFDETRDVVLVSSRHTDQIIALAMTDETGPQTEARWILGADGTIPYAGESFHHTHGVKTTADGDILFYDNGNFRPGSLSAGGDDPNYSRAVRIAVDDSGDDPSTWSATQVWDHRMIDPVTDELIYAPFISDADELSNGNILVTHGGATVDPNDYTASHVHLVEIDPITQDEGGDAFGGDIVWELRAGGDQPESTYRADRWASLYFGPLWATE
ncbi:MAG: aryl-sulfate sulfotransferase [Acidimicrobiales bacterium]